jgi:hypothetical protein
MIFTEEEDEIREIENILNNKGKTCINCHWSTATEGEGITTCGHHLENFSTNSFCAYWTNRNDPKLVAYFKRNVSDQISLDNDKYLTIITESAGFKLNDKEKIL